MLVWKMMMTCALTLSRVFVSSVIAIQPAVMYDRIASVAGRGSALSSRNSIKPFNYGAHGLTFVPALGWFRREHSRASIVDQHGPKEAGAFGAEPIGSRGPCCKKRNTQNDGHSVFTPASGALPCDFRINEPPRRCKTGAPGRDKLQSARCKRRTTTAKGSPRR